MGKRKTPMRPANSLSRTHGRRRPASRFLICCEGDVTEPGYFKYIRSELRSSLVGIRVVGHVGDPSQLVDHAIEERNRADRRARQEKDEYLRYDQVWCVVDVDEHQRLPDARSRSRRAGIELVVSNPCFEIWPLLHLVDHKRACNAKEAQKLLAEVIPGYRKKLDCAALRGKYKIAVKRAETLHRDHRENGNQDWGNPSTEVWKVVEQILSAARASRVQGRDPEL